MLPGTQSELPPNCLLDYMIEYLVEVAPELNSDPELSEAAHQIVNLMHIITLAEQTLPELLNYLAKQKYGEVIVAQTDPGQNQNPIAN